MYERNLSTNEALVDIRDVKINPDLPIEEKIKSFVEQVRNPYHFRVGKVKVRVSYADTDNTHSYICFNYVNVTYGI